MASLPVFLTCGEDNMLQLNLFTTLIHGAGDEILFGDQHQCITAMIATTCNSASSFLRALEPRNESVSKKKPKTTSWLNYFFLFFQLELKQLEAGFLKCVTKIAMP